MRNHAITVKFTLLCNQSCPHGEISCYQFNSFRRSYRLVGGKKYRLAGNVSCKLLKTGINHTYQVDHFTSKFVFRLYSINWRSDLEINEEIRLLNLLKEIEVSVSFPIKDIDNKYIQYLDAPEGIRQGLLFSYAKGDKQLNFSADLHFRVGETMAKIHQATLNLKLERVTYTPEIILEESFLHLRKFLPVDSDEMAWMVSAQRYLIAEINKAEAP